MALLDKFHQDSKYSGENVLVNGGHKADMMIPDQSGSAESNNAKLLQLAEITSKTSAFAHNPYPAAAMPCSSSSPSSSSSSEQFGANPCTAQIASSSMKELRLKGSAYIRSHASKHGISNASRKLMSEVLLKLRDHYVHVHGVMMLEDDFKDMHVHPVAATSVCGGKITKKKFSKSSLSNETLMNTFTTTTTNPKSKTDLWPLPQIPLPLPMSVAFSKSTPSLAPPPIVLSSIIAPSKNSSSGITSSLHLTAVLANSNSTTSDTNTTDDKNSEDVEENSKDWSSTSAGSDVERMMQEDTHQTDKDQPLTTCCTAKILALRRGDLLVFGTSILRPEAALHKVHNSSRKPKHVVIDELWKHYVEFHSKELMDSSNTAPGWVGSVRDDDEDDR